MSNTKKEEVKDILHNQDIKSFSLNYRKHDYSSLVNSLQSHPECLMSQIKMYIPLYHMFFSLNSSNYNSISLNHKHIVDHLHVKDDSTSTVDDMSVSQKTKKNQFFATLRLSDGNTSQTEEKIERNIFLKFSPLIDPVKYMINKYKDIDPSILRSIPDYANIDNENYKNLISYETNNTPYTDGFFTYLSSILLNEHNFPHGIDFYGSCLGVKQEFSYNIVDEIDYLNESEYFHEHLDDLFIFQNEEHREIFNADSRKNKTKLNIGPKKEDVDLVLDDILELDIVECSEDMPFNEAELTEENIQKFLGTQTSNDKDEITDNSGSSKYAEEKEGNKVISDKGSDHSSSVSSNSSNTTQEGEDGNGISEGSGEGDEEETEYSTCSSRDSDYSDTSSEEEIMCTLFDFPVEAIFMERCDNTMDNLMVNNELDEMEWTSCIFQIIMILSVYQKCFDFTHNDLHTNNIMYIKTDKQYLYYRINGATYKVPTYGRIYKIIDFGRAIYKFRGTLICSNSFHERGDAGSQYNFGQYFNDKKDKVLPNNSFDLCRLACCLYDFFIEDYELEKEVTKENPLIKMIVSWLLDDKERNILYKSNGEERYPEFKLYKMIARTIHSAVPEKQLNNSVFSSYKMSRSSLDKLKNKERKIVNIDKFPSYV